MRPNVLTRTIFSLALCPALLAGVPDSAGAQVAAPNATTLLRPDRVFDAETGQTHDGWLVLVEGNRITTCLLYTSPSPRD